LVSALDVASPFPFGSFSSSCLASTSFTTPTLAPRLSHLHRLRTFPTSEGGYGRARLCHDGVERR
jgi:hypothetical protein